MSRRTRKNPFPAYGVFSPKGQLQTTRETHDQAIDAARIIGGTDWELHGFTVEPVSVERGGGAKITQQDRTR